MAKTIKKLDPTTPGGRSIIMDKIIFNIQEGVVNLIYRWADEKKYEDFKEYEEAVRGWVAQALPTAKLVSMTKGFILKLQIEGFPYTPFIKFTKTTVQWSSKPVM